MATEQMDTPLKTSDMSAIGRAIAEGIESTRSKKTTNGQYAKREALRDPKPRLLWTSVTQNGYACDELSAKEIAAVSRIKRSGRYYDRKFEVIVKLEGNEKTLQLRYPNKTIDHRLEMRQYWRNFEDMVRQIAEIQEAEDLEDATAPAKVKR